ncbi:hypothetical protein [Actinomadura sp. HBU206391]|uniref:hypothetical protein n=1 Tax=Actinomadura sp. HBU206391 TaxID=2731692 RepID=UPI001650C759|nr:hypothetical protein [Actinomadura sp. HBU206391]MBC6458485.1 hypothetical protein [Actinomadura sp. HBU206391]
MSLVLTVVVVIAALGAFVGGRTGLAYWQGRGDYELVPDAVSVPKSGDDDVHRRVAAMPLQVKSGYLPRGGGFDSSSWAMWSHDRVGSVDIKFARHRATALRSGADVAADELRRSRAHSAAYVQVTPLSGLGDEAFEVFANGGITVNVRMRNIVLFIEFTARTDRAELRRVTGTLMKTSIGMVEKINAQA